LWKYHCLSEEVTVMPLRLQLVPALYSYGPLFVVIGLTGPLFKMLSGWQALLALGFALCGALMTSAALGIMFREVVSLRKGLESKTEKSHAR
jgi:hypothetical protein